MADINPLEEYAIKYKKVKINSHTYVLIPASGVRGYSMGDEYLSNVKYKIASTKENLTKEKYLIDEVISLEDLQVKYEVYDNEEIDFLCDVYLDDEKESIIIVDIVDDKVVKRKVSIRDIYNLPRQEVFERQKNIPSIVLNEESFIELLESDDLDELKGKLERLRKLIEVFLEREKSDYVTRIVVEDGKIANIETDAVVVESTQAKPVRKATTVKKTKPNSGDFSVKGLEGYLKERIFGHDREIETIAKTIYMNYTAEGDEDVESLLLVGPTGTGKTETIRLASKYLSIPFVEVNSPNLVPQGIVGTSLEDKLYSLIVQANYDLALAAKGIVYLDELDKLGEAKSDFKADIPEILLKCVEGSEFQFTKERKEFTIDTTTMTKIGSGAFTRVFDIERGLGFAAVTRNYGHDITIEELKDRIKEKGYFGIELLDRLEIPAIYRELDMDTKKRILLESKISKYLKKKQRYERQFGVTLEADDSYIAAIFEALEGKRESVRVLNNLVKSTLNTAEYELCTNPNVRGKRLILTRKTVENPDEFTFL